MYDFGTLFLQSFLPNLAYQLPVLIALLVGFIIVITRWRKNPRVSLLILLAILIAFLVRILSTFTDSMLWYILYDINYTARVIVSSVLSVVFSLLTAVSWILLLIALFSKPKPKLPVVEP